MNAETIYKVTKEAIDAYAEMHKDDVENYTEEHIGYWERYGLHKPLTALYRLNNEALKEMYNKSAKGSSKPSLLAVKRVLKNAYRDVLKKAWWAGDLWVICDGYRLVGLKNAVPTIPTYDGGKDKYIPMNLETIWKPLFDGTYMEEVSLPNKADVKACILEHKARNDRRMMMKVGVRYLNPQYLLDIMEIIPNAKMYQTDDNPLHVVYFRDDDGNVGLLLPIRP